MPADLASTVLEACARHRDRVAMIDLLGRCFPNHSASWKSRLTDLIPSLGQQLDENPALADEIMGHTGKTLGIR